MHRQGRLADALAGYERHLAMNSDDASALFLAGTACLQLRDLPAAEDWLKQAAVLAPDVAEIHSNLGMVQGARGRHDDAIESFRRALVLRPDFAEAFNNLGEALWRLGRRQEAIDAYRQAIGIDPGLAAAQNNLGVALREDSHTATAEAAFRAALDSDPAFGDAHSNLCSLLLELRRPVAALAACDAYLDYHPGHSGALAFRVAALLQAGRVGAADALMSVDKLLQVDMIEPPPGYAGIAAFNSDLAAQILADSSLTVRPGGDATRLGIHTGNLADGRGGPVGLLEAMIRRAAQRYIGNIDMPTDHPFHCLSSDVIGRIDIWSVIMERGGHELPHLHAEAWLSGVYYARIPPSVTAAANGGSGWIGFGRPPDIFPLPQPAAIHWLRPEAGKMLLFPSYLFHETVPLAGDDQRISLAFDIFHRET